MTIRTDFTNDMPAADVHPQHHNDLAAAINTLMAGGGGGGGGITVGEDRTHTWTAEDQANGDSWYGTASVHYIQWTPDTSGPLTIPSPSDEMHGWEFFEGTVEGEDYPTLDGTDTNGDIESVGSASGDDVVTFNVEAGTTYTIALEYWDSGGAGQVIDLNPLYLALAARGGVDGALPAPGYAPTGYEWLLGMNADGQLENRLRAVIQASRGTVLPKINIETAGPFDPNAGTWSWGTPGGNSDLGVYTPGDNGNITVTQGGVYFVEGRVNLPAQGPTDTPGYMQLHGGLTGGMQFPYVRLADDWWMGSGTGLAFPQAGHSLGVGLGWPSTMVNGVTFAAIKIL